MFFSIVIVRVFSKEIPRERNLATKPQDHLLCSTVALSNCTSNSFFECSFIVITILNGPHSRFS